MSLFSSRANFARRATTLDGDWSATGRLAGFKSSRLYMNEHGANESQLSTLGGEEATFGSVIRGAHQDGFIWEPQRDATRRDTVDTFCAPRAARGIN